MWPMRCSDPNRMRRNAHRRRGFTLIEIVVVVAIVGVMASIAGWNLTQMQSRSRFGQAVRAVMGLINEGRATAVMLSGHVAAGTILNDAAAPCPVQFLTGPGVAINTANFDMTVIDRYIEVDGVAAMPSVQISCRVIQINTEYRDRLRLEPLDTNLVVGPIAGSYYIAFDGRGMATNLPGQTGVIGFIENVPASPARQRIIVNGGGMACIGGARGAAAGAAERCAQQR